MVWLADGSPLFLVWFHRAYRNLRVLGVETKASPAWAVVVWFIPVANIFLPYIRATEILWGSAEPEDERLGVRKWETIALRAWWVCWLMLAVPNFLLRLDERFELGWSVEVTALVSIVAGGLSALAGTLLCVFVVRTSDRQHRSAKRDHDISLVHPSPSAWARASAVLWIGGAAVVWLLVALDVDLPALEGKGVLFAAFMWALAGFLMALIGFRGHEPPRSALTVLMLCVNGVVVLLGFSLGILEMLF